MFFASNSILIDYTPPTFKERFKNYLNVLPRYARMYILNLFPIIQWIHRYNLSWLLQDAIAGVTVGMLMVPQGIAYAKIANLDPQYGLYTSFVGATLYCFFGTSKDISIGPITVVSLLVGQAVSRVREAHPEITGPEVAVTLSLFSGLVLVVIGLVRLGILVDFISEPSIAGYMTGSAITISMGQWPKVFGLSKVSTRDAPYLILYHFFKNLKNADLDAAFGLVALLALYMIKLGSVKLASHVPSALKQPLFFLGIMRSGLVVILGTLISYIVNLHHRTDPIIHIIKEVPAGFDAMAIPSIHFTVLKEASDVLPSIILILILEHVSVAKSFGNMSNYTINPNQEILSIGISNIIGSFFGAYPCTGAFSRTAVMYRSGAKTPMAGVFSGAVVVLALYVLTPAFYYIPEAILAAVVIHAVIDLIAGPAFMKKLWSTSVLEFIIFAITVIVTCFMDVETAIYISIALSLLLMLFRLTRPQVISIGRLKLTDCYDSLVSTTSISGTTACQKSVVMEENILNVDSRYIYVNEKDPNFRHHLESLPPGVVIIQLSQSMLYPNSGYVSERIIQIVKSKTSSGRDDMTDVKVKEKEDIPWNQPVVQEAHRLIKPCLEYLVIDLSAVDMLDVTALHHLHLLKKTLDHYAGGKSVEWHFCHVPPKLRHLLVNSGFGSIPNHTDDNIQITESTATEHCFNNRSSTSVQTPTIKLPPIINTMQLLPKDRYPAFHWDVESAIHSLSVRQQNLNSSSVTVAVY